MVMYCALSVTRVAKILLIETQHSKKTICICVYSVQLWYVMQYNIRTLALILYAKHRLRKRNVSNQLYTILMVGWQ